MATKTGSPLPAFVVDKAGLAKILERRGKAFAAIELIQNAWDEETTQVDVVLEPDGKGIYRLTVEDDNPEGFRDLTHAYTLFAESAKKGTATKRGRFNLGEKLVIAICDRAEIATTKGTITFTGDSREHSAKKRKAGSRFTGWIRMTAADVADVESAIRTLLPPDGITTTYNLEEVPHRAPIRTFTASLRTELADEEGRLRPTTRKTTVGIYEPLPDEDPSIYEMGIPVVATGDRWHVNIAQKVPLGTDRDSVQPSYLRDVRTAVLNNAYDAMDPEDTKATWVTNAMEDPKASVDAVRAAFVGKFGEGAVIHDPNDTEANKIAMEHGLPVVTGGSLSKKAWGNVKGFGIALPAGKVTPSPNPNEGSENLKLMSPDHWPPAVRNVVEMSMMLGERLLDADVAVRIVNDPKWPFAATYGRGRHGDAGQLTYNLGRLGHKFFESGVSAKVLDLIVHEFGHHYCSDHLDRRYLDALSDLAGRLAMLALEEPDVFARHRTTTTTA